MRAPFILTVIFLAACNIADTASKNAPSPPRISQYGGMSMFTVGTTSVSVFHQSDGKAIVQTRGLSSDSLKVYLFIPGRTMKQIAKDTTMTVPTIYFPGTDENGVAVRFVRNKVEIACSVRWSTRPNSQGSLADCSK